jgi:hypothetical protein
MAHVTTKQTPFTLQPKLSHDKLCQPTKQPLNQAFLVTVVYLVRLPGGKTPNGPSIPADMVHETTTTSDLHFLGEEAVA